MNAYHVLITRIQDSSLVPTLSCQVGIIILVLETRRPRLQRACDMPAQGCTSQSVPESGFGPKTVWFSPRLLPGTTAIPFSAYVIWSSGILWARALATGTCLNLGTIIQRLGQILPIKPRQPYCLLPFFYHWRFFPWPVRVGLNPCRVKTPGEKKLLD